MNWLREDELVERLRGLAKAEPREEFVQQLERRLAWEAKRLKRKRRISRNIAKHAGKTAAVLLLGGFITSVFTSATWQPEVTSSPSRENRYSLLADTEVLRDTPDLSYKSDVPGDAVPKQAQRQSYARSVPEPEARSELVQPSKTLAAVQPQASEPVSSLYKGIAARHLRNMLGEGAADFQVIDALSNYRGEYGNVVFTRMVKGIPYLGESYRIGVTADGQVSGVTMNTYRDFSLPLDKFPEPVEIMTQKQAEESFARNMRLVYAERQPVKLSMFGGRPLETRPVLQYLPPMAGYIDAKTGTPVSIGTTADQPVTVLPIVAEGRPLVARSATEVSRLLTEEFLQPVSADDLQKVETGDEHIWLWKGGELTVSAASGRVMRLELHQARKSSQLEAITMQEAEQRAVDFLQTYLDPKVTQLMVMERTAGEAGRPHRVQFQLSHDGIPVIDRLFLVDIDQYSGQIVAFSGDFHSANVDLPDKRKIVSAERAAAEYLRRFPLQLAYIWPNEGGKKAESPILVYTPFINRSNLVYVDATTGEFVEMSK
ncbi:YcdB/YcdC domain-containing protein [Brevibacillus marinus]|uniref:YcdB/YcdC domain-containing protein n=1 Tax=Brevibacillus marinus TaxID=2496837 RepID=UPI000F81B32E|nr:YcdB/YcdC domain-containing protein [Brevibacillus marinus]